MWIGGLLNDHSRALAWSLLSAFVLEQASSSSVDDRNRLLKLSLEQCRVFRTKGPDWQRCGLPRSCHVCSTGYLSRKVERVKNDAEPGSRLQKRGDRMIEIRSALTTLCTHLVPILDSITVINGMWRYQCLTCSA